MRIIFSIKSNFFKRHFETQTQMHTHTKTSWFNGKFMNEKIKKPITIGMQLMQSKLLEYF